MELKLLKEKRKNESNEIYNKIDDLTEKLSEFQQKSYEGDTLINNSSNLSSNPSSNNSSNFSSSSRGKIISTYKYLLL